LLLKDKENINNGAYWEFTRYLFNGLQKKTQKTSRKDVEKVRRIIQENFDYKKKGERNI